MVLGIKLRPPYAPALSDTPAYVAEAGLELTVPILAPGSSVAPTALGVASGDLITNSPEDTGQSTGPL